MIGFSHGLQIGLILTMPRWARQSLAAFIALIGSGVFAVALRLMGTPSLVTTLTAGLSGLGLFYLVRAKPD